MLFQALDGDLFTAALRCAKAQACLGSGGQGGMFPTSHSPDGAWMEGRAGGREVGSPDLGGGKPAGWGLGRPRTHALAQ